LPKVECKRIAKFSQKTADGLISQAMVQR